MENQYIQWFENLSADDIAQVGGKNASLGEMIAHLKQEGVRVPDGFAVTARAYREFVSYNQLRSKIETILNAMEAEEKSLAEAGKAIRSRFLEGEFPEGVARAITQSYAQLSRHYDQDPIDVAVRSSATAEDLPEASFAGQQETFLNISGEHGLLNACRQCFASLFTDRAISYRQEQGFDHLEVALSVGVQKMVRSDRAGAGVMFSLDTETGFPDVVSIDAAWGLGENVVQGSVTPDSYKIFKPLLKDERYIPIVERKLGDKKRKMVYATGGSQVVKNVKTRKHERRQWVLTDAELLQLARWACLIEDHYQKPMDMEWAKDGDTGELFIVQARPETVQSQKQGHSLKAYQLKEKGELLLTGLSIGDAIAAGRVCKIQSAGDIEQFTPGQILVTEMTDPDWVPIMKQAAGIITEQGGRTCHAAIVSRELGIPAVVGTGEATERLSDNQAITLSCAQGDEGYVYDGILDYQSREIDLADIPQTRTRIMMNIASPGAAFRWWRLPAKGIGLARMEFIINNIIKIHPLALVHYQEIEDRKTREQIDGLTRGYPDKTAYFVDHLAQGIAAIAASQYPEPVILRLSDFKTNEYAALIGGSAYEPDENNPMLGFRGASRYYSEQYRPGFALECQAIKKAREEIGLGNLLVMVPFCRTPDEADQVLATMAENGLKRGEDGLAIYVMCEIPANVVLADQFAQRFDGFSIGSNDLTQLVLGVDRDSSELAHLFDEQNPAIKRMIAQLIRTAHQHDCKVGICGQAPSDYPEFARFLVQAGIDSVSLNPDSVIGGIEAIGEMEKEISDV